VLTTEVKEALAKGQPVVALESTLISHGLPWPENKKIGLELEEIVRNEGATPATIAIMDGKIRIGLSEADLDKLATPTNSVQKVSRRDISVVLAKGQIGATTVAATSLLASMCGIHLFATGGIGGVHRDGHITMDVSADLTELGRTPIGVVSAGIKSILDIGRTLEYLETMGVTVASYGTDSFPSFYTVDSGFKSPCRLDTPLECATALFHNLNLNLNSGIIIANPIPKEFAAEGRMIEDAIQIALEETHSQGITGRDVTPYILKRVAVLTENKSLQSNLALIKNNAKLAAQIAVQLSKIQQNL